MSDDDSQYKTIKKSYVSLQTEVGTEDNTEVISEVGTRANTEVIAEVRTRANTEVTAEVGTRANTEVIAEVGTRANTEVRTKAFKCKLCGKIFSKKQSLKRHKLDCDVKKMMKYLVEGTLPAVDTQREHLLRRSNKRLASKKLEKARLLRQAEAKTQVGTRKAFKCKTCKARFSEKQYLNQHQSACHVKRVKKNIHMPFACPEVFTCEICKMKFSKKWDLDQHFLLHKAERSICEICICETESSMEPDDEKVCIHQLTENRLPNPEIENFKYLLIHDSYQKAYRKNPYGYEVRDYMLKKYKSPSKWNDLHKLLVNSKNQPFRFDLGNHLSDYQMKIVQRFLFEHSVEGYKYGPELKKLMKHFTPIGPFPYEV